MALRNEKKAVSIVEYMSLIIIIIGAMIIMGPYVIRAFSGAYKKSGESFGLGRRFNSNSVECDYTQLTANRGIWYDATCYEAHTIGCDPSDPTCCAPGNRTCEETAMENCTSDFCSNR